LVPLAPDGTHEMEIHLRLLRAIAKDAALPAAGALAPRWVVTAEEKRAAAERWKALGVEPGKAIAVFLGGRGAKKWPAERFVEVAAALPARGFVPVFFGGPGEKNDLEKLRMQAGVKVAPALPLREFAAMVAPCAAVITADTG